MANNGAAHPDKVDLISSSDSYVKLIIVQTDPLTDELLLGLQEKLNNYLSFVQNGQLYEVEPNTKGLPVIISIDLFENGNALTNIFLERIKAIFLQQGVALEWQDRHSELGDL